jgi:hypothetical protein
MYSIPDNVLCIGPPPVSTYGSMNNEKPPMVERTMMTTMVGFSIGSVMCQNCFDFVAPSRLAASYNSPGMFCNPTRNSTM